MPGCPLTDPSVRFSRTGLLRNTHLALTSKQVWLKRLLNDSWGADVMPCTHFCVLLPRIASLLASSIQPFEQQLIYLVIQVREPLEVPTDSVVIPIPSQLQVYRPHNDADPVMSVALDPFLECTYGLS